MRRSRPRRRRDLKTHHESTKGRKHETETAFFVFSSFRDCCYIVAEPRGFHFSTYRKDQSNAYVPLMLAPAARTGRSAPPVPSTAQGRLGLLLLLGQERRHFAAIAE